MKNKKNKKLKFIFRHPTLDDVNELVELEKEVWKENAFKREQIISIIKVFSKGSVVAIYNNHIVGYVVFEYVDNVAKHPNFSWYDITDNGTILNSHKPNGEYLYGINLSVRKFLGNQHLGFSLNLKVMIDIILTNKRGIFLGSRIPYFARYKKNNPEISVDEYVHKTRQGKPFDPELRLYNESGTKIVKILPDYFNDPDSLNYGVLIYRNNPFYNWPFRKLLAYLIRFIPDFGSEAPDEKPPD